MCANNTSIFIRNEEYVEYDDTKDHHKKLLVTGVWTPFMLQSVKHRTRAVMPAFGLLLSWPLRCQRLLVIIVRRMRRLDLKKMEIWGSDVREREKDGEIYRERERERERETMDGEEGKKEWSKTVTKGCCRGRRGIEGDEGEREFPFDWATRRVFTSFFSRGKNSLFAFLF